MNKMFTFKACSSVLDFGGRRSDGMLGNKGQLPSSAQKGGLEES